jgi:signal transduction histidine kinase
MTSADSHPLPACCHEQPAFEPMRQATAAGDSFQIEHYKALFRVVARIRETLDLDTIFQAAATEVRQLLNADRVGVFRFFPDCGWNAGEFVSEAVLPAFPSALAAKVQDHCFGERYASHYQQGRVQAVADTHTAKLPDCYANVLAQFQIRANLVVPLLQGSHLWGLLCIHQCAAPREWQPEEIEFASQIADYLAAALKQAELFTATQQQSKKLAEALEQLKKSQSQLIQSEKLSGLGQLMAGIAHEINNPVNFICGNLAHADQYAQQLIELVSLYRQEHLTPSAELQECLAEAELDFIIEDFPKLLSSMQIGGDRIRQLVLSLRNFSRSDVTEMLPTNLHEGIDNTLLLLHHRLGSKSGARGIRVICEYGDLPLVECYTNQINQVFMNLIGNAIDALEEQLTVEQTGTQLVASTNPIDNPTEPCSTYCPQVTIRTMQIPDPQGSNPRAIICIADNGAGIPLAVQEKLFEPFFTTKPIGQGTGLGLSISRDIVMKHGGDLQCYSQPGEGTEFWIELPVKQLNQIKLDSTASEGKTNSESHDVLTAMP